jgi:hypothetical protein
LDGGGFSGGGGLDVGDEAVAGGGDGFDETGLTGVVVQGFAQEADGAGEGAFGDGGIGPDGVEELLLADEAAAVLDEVEEQAEGLGFEGEGRAIRDEAESGVVGLEAIEAENQRGAPCAAWCAGVSLAPLWTECANLRKIMLPCEFHEDIIPMVSA